MCVSEKDTQLRFVRIYIGSKHLGERVRQIETQALKKLKSPNIGRKLKEYVSGNKQRRKISWSHLKY